MPRPFATCEHFPAAGLPVPHHHESPASSAAEAASHEEVAGLWLAHYDELGGFGYVFTQSNKKPAGAGFVSSLVAICSFAGYLAFRPLRHSAV